MRPNIRSLFDVPSHVCNCRIRRGHNGCTHFRQRAQLTRHTAERLAIGIDYPGEYVVCNEIGDPYSPAVLSRYWRDAVKAAEIRHIKLHAARHTCATLMHLQGVPVAVIAAWIGHKDASTTMKIYAHSQNDALKAAGASLNRVVTTRDTGSR